MITAHQVESDSDRKNPFEVKKKLDRAYDEAKNGERKEGVHHHFQSGILRVVPNSGNNRSIGYSANVNRYPEATFGHTEIIAQTKGSG